MTQAVESPPQGALEYRDAKLADVRYAERLVTLVVMPYDERALVEHHGRMIHESVAPGAFKGIQRRLTGGPGIKANRDHDTSRLVGRAVGLYPDRPEGLVADVRISNTDLGDETLTLADDGLLDASAGFLPMPGGEEWPTRDERRLTRVFLGHIGFTSEPAFEGAKVLAVRNAVTVGATPNLDVVLGWKLEEAWGKLST